MDLLLRGLTFWYTKNPKVTQTKKQIECLVLSSHQLSNEGQLDQWFCLL